MGDRERVVFLFDVDNTLLDNDAVRADLDDHLVRTFGTQCRDGYFSVLEQHRETVGYVDYLDALQQYHLRFPRLMQLAGIARFLLEYPFHERLYPGALALVRECRKLGRPVVLTDGDVVFQPRKVHRSGIAEAVDDHVLLYVHKEQSLDDVEQLYPADRYVLFDDKPRLVEAIKNHWEDRVTTIMPRQGHYANDTAAVAAHRPADVVVERIADGAALDLAALATSPPRG